MSSLTGLGLRNKVGLGKSNDSPSKPKQQGNSITGLGLRNKAGLGSKSNDSSSIPKQQGSSITGLGLRNKAAGLAGNKKGHDDDEPYRAAKPMSALVDPASFAPPPKNVNYYGAGAAERQVGRIAQKGPLTPSEYQAREKEKADRQREEEAIEKEERRLEREERQRLRLAAQQEREDAQGPQVSAKNDTTGLSTSQFAPPVARSIAQDGTVVIRPTAPPRLSVKPPLLPPRLPSRQNSSPETEWIGSQAQSPTQRPQVPTRIGTGSSSSSSSSHKPYNASDNAQLSELQSRFARMKTSSPTTEPAEHIAKRWKPVDTPNRNHGMSGNPVHASPAQDEDMGSPIEMKDNTLPLGKKAPPPRPKKKAELSSKIIEVSPHLA